MHERNHPYTTADAGPAARVDVWHIPTTLPDKTVPALRALLSPDERERADRLAPAARARFTITRAALRSLLGRETGQAPSRIRIAYSANGKPSLRTGHRQQLHFSVSHAADLALVAISAGGPVGIDVERLRATPRIDRIASRLFDTATATLLASLPQRDRLLAFHHAWTQREAFVKAIGGTLFATRDPLAFRWPRTAGPVVQLGTDHTHWTVLPLEPADDYVATLVAAGTAGRITVHETGDDLRNRIQFDYEEA